MVENKIVFPNVLVFDKTDIQQSSGLFPEIGYYWLVRGNSIHFWSFNQKHDLTLPNYFNQKITHVLLAPAVPKVFDESITVFVLCWCDV